VISISIESSPGAAILAGADDLKSKTIAVAAPGSLPNLITNAILEKY